MEVNFIFLVTAILLYDYPSTCTNVQFCYLLKIKLSFFATDFTIHTDFILIILKKSVKIFLICG